MQTDLARRETLSTLVGTYKQACEEIRQAYTLLETAEKRLKSAFTAGPGYYFDVNSQSSRSSHETVGEKAAEACIAKLKKDAWRCIIDRLEIRKVLSIARREALDRQLHGEPRYHGDIVPPLPEITEENILSMLTEGVAKATDYANEAVLEIFDWLRPRGGANSKLKTNEKWRLGKKVIIYCVEPTYNGRFSVKFHYLANLTALDNVFHMLAGRGPLNTYHGPLHDAIKESPTGEGETDFFRFCCKKNGNLHLEFKDLDLVAKINKAAGGNQIKGT